MSDRFHRAARDGLLEVLQEATKLDSNSRDYEDGMTPTLVAAYEGKLEALRILVGRGGDPDKCDYYGNTALHAAAARGFTPCVTFLVNFGANIWALDNEYHSPKELAALNNHDEILRFLDRMEAEQEATKPKECAKKKEQATKDATKRIKDFEKLQEKVRKEAEQENNRLAKEREKLARLNLNEENGKAKKGVLATLSRSAGLIAKKKMSPQSPQQGGFKFSDVVMTNSEPRRMSLTGRMKASFSPGIPRDAAGANRRASIQPGMHLGSGTVSASEFRVSHDGRRSISALSGVRRDSEIIFVPKKIPETADEVNGDSTDVPGGFKERGKLSGLFGVNTSAGKTLFERPSSLFDRPGFGNYAFRPSISVLASGGIEPSVPEGSDEEDSDIVDSDDEIEPEAPVSALQLFLAAHGLTEYIGTFVREKIDLEALMELTEDDLHSLQLPLGPRKKLLKAIKDRRKALNDPGDVTDTPL